jgi:ribosomal protein S18 acetylase RimI-like enzyme
VSPAAIRSAKFDDSTAMLELLAAAIGDTGHRLDEAARRYRHDATTRFLVAVIDNQTVGLVGFVVGDSEVTLLHIATAESVRRRGIGRRLVDAVHESVDHRLRVVAETDHAAIAFYQALGFTVESLGEKYPGVERFTVRRSNSGPTQRRR